MSDDLKLKIWAWFTHLTVRRIGVSALALITALSMYTLYENRQKVFEMSKNIGFTHDFVVPDPTKAQHEIVKRFLKLHPEVGFITLIDADPVSNRRNVVHRFFNSDSFEELFKRADQERPGSGDGPLFTEDPANNAQVLAVVNGEFLCTDVTNSILVKQFPHIAKAIVLSCRVPLPPAFGKAGGWFAMHMMHEPTDLSTFKTDALTLSYLYFESLR